MNKQAEEAASKVLYKNVLEIMEQLEKSCDQIKELPIDNAKRLQGIVDLIYDKAVNGPNFSKTAVFMTLHLAGINVSANDPDNPHKTFNFLEFIIEKCQMEFDKNWKDDPPLYKKMRYFAMEFIDSELDNIIDKQKRIFKTKTLGNIRFIGELFKHSKLQPMSIVLYMLELLKNKDDDRLACLCELLKMVGEKLENTINISYFFIKMQEIIDTKSTNISSCIRELLQDVINLRNSNWLPQKHDLNLKKIEQTQKEADTEQLHVQVMNSGSITTPQKDDKIGGDGVLSTDESQDRAAAYTTESQKFVNKPPPINGVTLGSKSLFDQWGTGSTLKTCMLEPIMNTANVVPENTPVFPDQFPPANLADRKRYDPDYLKLLSYNPMCQKKPENLPDFDIYIHCSNKNIRSLDIVSYSRLHKTSDTSKECSPKRWAKFSKDSQHRNSPTRKHQ